MQEGQQARRAARATVARAVVLYLVLCAVWIGYSHGAVRAFGPDYPILYWIEANDRWAMVFVSAIGLAVLATRIQTRSALAQLELTENERAQANLMGHLPGIAYRCHNDLTRTMTYVSDGCRDLTGYAPEDFLDNRTRDFAGVVHDADRQRVGQALADALNRGRCYRMEYRIVTATGTPKWVMDSGSGVEESEGRFTVLEGLMVDITQQKEAQGQLEAQQEHLEEIVAARTAELTAEIEQRRELERKLIEMTTRDALTGLYNRREMERFLNQELGRCARYSRMLSVVMIDIDHFKRLNDTYGHQAGDEVLRWVADVLRDGVRATDRAVRYGGEEMALILPETSPEAAQLVADRLRARVADEGVTLQTDGDGRHVEVAFSAGVAAFPVDGANPEALLAAADAALYEAKRKGRNRVERARPSGPPSPPLRIADQTS